MQHPTDADPPGLSAVPARLRPRAAPLLGHRIGQLLLHTVRELLRVQIFDRSMTLAAQAFTSVFPILIMLGALFGQRIRASLADTVHLPEATQHLFQEALRSSGMNSFGALGCLIVLLSATGLARALTRAYAAVWEVRGTPHGPAALWRWLVTVLALVLLMVGTRAIGATTAGLPLPHVLTGAILFVADCGLTVLVPRLLLGRCVPLRKLLAGGCAYALFMLALRPAGGLYLPRSLRVSEERYGTIGLAFTYISWLYVLSFALLVSAVVGRVLNDDVTRLAGQVRRRLAGARGPAR
ncbi:MAG TPA: YhjD/YihY/BrkB family envelope integrity protein [Pilimelia sp.]|nr:YhjD/YihY/BrkB family envelope integrity protein [Pilimelia sp.]